jgi:hypothetical protein
VTGDPGPLAQRRSSRAATRIRRRLAIERSKPPAVAPVRRISVSMPAVEWEALLEKAGL